MYIVKAVKTGARWPRKSPSVIIAEKKARGPPTVVARAGRGAQGASLRRLTVAGAGRAGTARRPGSQAAPAAAAPTS